MSKLPAQRSNVVGVAGVSLFTQEEKSRKKMLDGSIKTYVYPCIYWRVYYNVDGVGKNQKFRFNKQGGCREAFEKAVRKKRKEQLREYGKTNIVLSKIDQYFKDTVDNAAEKLTGYSLT